MLLGGESGLPVAGSRHRGEFPLELAWLAGGSFGRGGRGAGVLDSGSGLAASCRHGFASRT